MTGKGSKPIILLGGGGHARSTLDVIASLDNLSVEGILDDLLKPGGSVLGVNVLGSTDLIKAFARSHDFVVALGKIGRSAGRRTLAERCWSEGGRLRSIISPFSYVSPHAFIDEGTAVFHGAVINAGVHVGRNCIINSMALIEHDSVIGDHTHISTGALVNGSCKVGENVFVGSGSVLHHKVELNDGEVLNAGEIRAREPSTGITQFTVGK